MRTRLWLGAVAAVLVTGLAGALLGSVRLAPHDVWLAMIGHGDPAIMAIVRGVRLPRTALAACVGGALAVTGAALQGTLRNPLAEPYILGISGGAAVGAVLAVASGLAGISAGVPLAAFAGALAAALLVLAIARSVGGAERAEPRTLLMAGVVIGAFANAVIMVALANAPASAVRGATWWMMGSVADGTWSRVGWVAGPVLVGSGLLVAWARDIDALALGGDAAAALGVDVARAARRVYITSALIAAATVAAAGLIGFVGLIVPHIVRAAGIRTHRALLIGSALGGAALLMAADVVARVAMPPTELPLGAITALVGVPFFIAQLRRRGIAGDGAE